MNPLVWAAIAWLFVNFLSLEGDITVNAFEIEQNTSIDKLNNLLNHQNNDFSLNHDHDVKNSIHNEKDEREIDRDEKMAFEEDNDETEDMDTSTDSNEKVILDHQAIRKKLRKHRIKDISVGCFFFLASIWLVLATGYSIILLFLLRLQARGELDIYDENLGRVVLFNGRITLHFGCILRRYAIQLEEDYQRQLHRNSEDLNEESPEAQRIRIMTREERRKAVEELLGDSAKTSDIESGHAIDKKIGKAACCRSLSKVNASNRSSAIQSADAPFSCFEEEPVCSICLIEYEPTDSVFRSRSCSHMFHRECLFSWLERRNNTECPCCRVPLVSEDDVWEVVQRMRKEQRKKRRNENRFVKQLLRWRKSNRYRQDEQSQPAVSPLDIDRTDTSTSHTSGSDNGIDIDQESSIELHPDDIDENDTDDDQELSPSPTALNPDEIGGENTDNQHESSPNNNI